MTTPRSAPHPADRLSARPLGRVDGPSARGEPAAPSMAVRNRKGLVGGLIELFRRLSEFTRGRRPNAAPTTLPPRFQGLWDLHTPHQRAAVLEIMTQIAAANLAPKPRAADLPLRNGPPPRRRGGGPTRLELVDD